MKRAGFSLWMMVAILTFSATRAGAAPLPPEPDKGFVTEVHKEKVGQIVFARRAAAVTTPEKPTEFVDRFKSGEDIYFRAYLPSSLNNAFRAQGVQCADPFRVWAIAVDGKQVGRSPNDPYFYWETLDKNAFTQSTSVRFEKPLNGAKDSDGAIWNAFNDLVAPTLTAGEHTVTLAVRGSCDDLANGRKTTALNKDLAIGTFAITIAKGAAVDVLPKPALNDVNLVKEMAKLIQNEWRDDKVLKVVIVDKQWTPQYEQILGRQVLQRRTIATLVAVKQENGCRLFDVVFEQPVKGSGFGPTARAGTGDFREVACEGIK